MMGAMASQITSLAFDYSIIYTGADRRKLLRATGPCAGNSPVAGEFPAQKALRNGPHLMTSPW